MATRRTSFLSVSSKTALLIFRWGEFLKAFLPCSKPSVLIATLGFSPLSDSQSASRYLPGIFSMLRDLIKQSNKQSFSPSKVSKGVRVGITQCSNALNAARSGPLGSKAQPGKSTHIRAVLPKQRFRSFDKVFTGKIVSLSRRFSTYGVATKSEKWSLVVPRHNSF